MHSNFGTLPSPFRHTFFTQIVFFPSGKWLQQSFLDFPWLLWTREMKDRHKWLCGDIQLVEEPGIEFISTQLVPIPLSLHILYASQWMNQIDETLRHQCKKSHFLIQQQQLLCYLCETQLAPLCWLDEHDTSRKIIVECVLRDAKQALINVLWAKFVEDPRELLHRSISARSGGMFRILQVQLKETHEVIHNDCVCVEHEQFLCTRDDVGCVDLHVVLYTIQIFDTLVVFLSAIVNEGNILVQLVNSCLSFWLETIE
mmetsp:Transcript_4465/g.16873  ORF Transcript_4465/g.16873 Transcript_4465/m.16873 type:complete len:257 (+) Transcript_4465:1499-2269(+)